MNILKYKYKAHKLINTLFYVAVFGIGFILGFGTNKIDFNKLISQVLMIDNAKAYTIVSGINEAKIVEMFSTNEDFDISINHNIFCRTDTSTPQLKCYALSDDALNYFTFSYTNYDKIKFFLDITNAKGFQLDYNTKNNTFEVHSMDSSVNLSYSFYNSRMFFGFIPKGYESDSWVTSRKLLDFSEYSVKVEYNENLFKDNPDFKEVCVSNYDTFSITSNSVDGYDENEQPYYHSFDFMWFPNGMKGISTYRYDTEEENHVYIFEESETTFSGWWYWLNTKEEIDLYFGRDNPGLYLELRGYTDKYKYYNYTMYPFEMAFTPSYHYYPVFWFKDPYIEYLDGTKKDDSDKYCFYIKNEYDVNILNHDSMGDVYGDVTILGGTISSDSTSKNLKDMDNSTLVNTLYNLLNRLKNTINFINYHIESLFFSMPLLFQMFIVSVLLIFAIKLIINMIIK